jgi:hypothetical protein
MDDRPATGQDAVIFARKRIKNVRATLRWTVYLCVMGLVLLIVALAAADGGADAQPDSGVPIWLMARAPSVSPDQEVIQLGRQGDGYVFKDRALEAQIARDGVVAFRERRSVLDHIGLLQGFGVPQSEPLQELLFGPNSKRPPSPDSFTRRPPLFAGRIEPSQICPPDSCYALPDSLLVGGTGVSMDLTEELMRSFGQDPYGAVKARFLAATFDFRMKLAMAAQREDSHRSLDQLQNQLIRVWADSRYSTRERRRILFELWCETDQTPEGVRAAHEIEAFIQRQLPCGSPDAFAHSELQAYQSSEAGRGFLPYPDCKALRR